MRRDGSSSLHPSRGGEVEEDERQDRTRRGGREGERGGREAEVCNAFAIIYCEQAMSRQRTRIDRKRQGRARQEFDGREGSGGKAAQGSRVIRKEVEPKEVPQIIRE